MQKKITVVIILALFFLAGIEAMWLNLSRKEKLGLEEQVYKASSQRASLNRELNKTKQLVESIAKSLESKEEELLNEQGRAKTLEAELNKTTQDIEIMGKELSLANTLRTNTENRLERAEKKIEDLKKSRQLPMKKKIEMLSKSLNEKEKQVSLLQGKSKTSLVLAETNKSLVEKVKELELSKIKLTAELEETRDQLVKKSKEFSTLQEALADLTNANAGLKTQAAQFSGILTAKELGLANQKQEIDGLKLKIAGLEEKRAELETKLNTVSLEQENAKRIALEVEELNATLQEKISQFSQPIKDKEKAEELKHKVEVILTPQNP